jgi:hypothetical protein
VERFLTPRRNQAEKDFRVAGSTPLEPAPIGNSVCLAAVLRATYTQRNITARAAAAAAAAAAATAAAAAPAHARV